MSRDKYNENEHSHALAFGMGTEEFDYLSVSENAI
jgi:hypothetical protein